MVENNTPTLSNKSDDNTLSDNTIDDTSDTTISDDNNNDEELQQKKKDFDTAGIFSSLHIATVICTIILLSILLIPISILQYKSNKYDNIIVTPFPELYNNTNNSSSIVTRSCFYPIFIEESNNTFFCESLGNYYCPNGYICANLYDAPFVGCFAVDMKCDNGCTRVIDMDKNDEYSREFYFDTNNLFYYSLIFSFIGLIILFILCIIRCCMLLFTSQESVSINYILTYTSFVIIIFLIILIFMISVMVYFGTLNYFIRHSHSLSNCFDNEINELFHSIHGSYIASAVLFVLFYIFIITMCVLPCVAFDEQNK